MLEKDKQDMDIPVVMNVEQLAQILQIGRNSAYGLVRSGKIMSIRIGRQIRIPRHAVLQFLKEEAA